MDIQTILSQVDLGSMALPEFQRGYVWNRDQVRAFVRSLYRRYPVGSLLVWVTKTETANARGDGKLAPGVVKLILDGQQRITSLYGIIRGNPPQFFDGNAAAFTGLYFSLEEEGFEFYSKAKMKDNPVWINVSELMRVGVGQFIARLYEMPQLRDKVQKYINTLTALDGIKTIDLHIEEVIGEDKTVDVVVDIFNQANTGGKKLSQGDLALAKICAEWPQARSEMKIRLDKWHRAGFDFRLELLLRCINAIVTGKATFSALKEVDTAVFGGGMTKTEKAIDYLLNLISSRLGLDHDRVLGGRYSLPLMARYLMQRGGRLTDYRERDKLLHWYVHTFLWGRYAGATETVLMKDLAAIETTDGALDRLVDLLRQSRGDLHLSANDFAGQGRGARFYPLLYMLTRVWKARDWATGVELSSHLLGSLNQLQLHHIFPKTQLYARKHKKAEVNAIANFTFLTQDTNLLVGSRDPAEYLADFAEKQPGAIESHWIPMDRALWKYENYLEFLTARRDLLAKAANDFLDSLYSGKVPETEVGTPIMERPATEVPGGIVTSDEERALAKINAQLVQMGLPAGQIMYEVTDPQSGKPLAILDLAWPDGLQEGLSEPVALLLEEPEETEKAANRAGFRFFTDEDEFLMYVKEKVLALHDSRR